MMKLVSIAHFHPKDRISVKAIEILMNSRRALVEQEVVCPEIFFVAIFLAILEPDSAIRERHHIMVNESGKNVQLD